MTTKNEKYKANKKAKGLKKITLWLPVKSEDDIKLLASVCCDNQDLIPHTVRSLKTGKMKGINNA
jgi:hypothetical protein